MEIIIKGEPSEISVLILAIQERKEDVANKEILKQYLKARSIAFKDLQSHEGSPP